MLRFVALAVIFVILGKNLTMEKNDAIVLEAPLSEAAVRRLKVGDRVLLNGVIFTARDAAHKYLTEHFDSDLAKRFNNGVIYHCGPVVEKTSFGWEFVSAGPTTSIREEPYEADLIKRYNLRAIIGKGGMGERTAEALRDRGAVYLSATGGAGAILAAAVKKVLAVHKPEFGTPEAIWEIEVEDFPCIVTMDSCGGSLHRGILNKSTEALRGMLLK